MHEDGDEGIEAQGSGSAGSLLAGLVVGAILGAGIALLLAPRSGEDTREDLSRRARRLRADLRRRRRRFRHRMAEEAEHARDRLFDRD